MVLMKKASVSESPSGRAPERSPDGISRKQKLAAAEKYFRGSLCWFGDFREFIGERGRAKEARGAHDLLGAPPWGAPRGLVASSVALCLGSQIFWIPSVMEKNHPIGFIPFGLRLIFLSEKGQKHEKNRNWHWPLSQ